MWLNLRRGKTCSSSLPRVNPWLGRADFAHDKPGLAPGVRSVDSTTAIFRHDAQQSAYLRLP